MSFHHISAEHPELAAMISGYERELPVYLSASRPYWAKKLGIRSGTLTNLEQGLSWIATGGNASLDAGCLACQSKTYEVLTGVQRRFPTKAYVVVRWRIGWGMEHHAVMVHKKGDPPTVKGLLFDPWIDQTAKVYPYQAWVNHFAGLNVIGRSQAE